MKKRFAIAVLAPFASAAFLAPAAAAPVKLGPPPSEISLEDRAAALWPQFTKTSALLNQAVTKAQANADTRLDRPELKAMIMLRLRLDELSVRMSLHRDDLAHALKELELAQKMARSERLAGTFSDFDQQADHMRRMIAGVLSLMEENNEITISKYGA
jgi:hypothetical protein